MTPFFGNSPSPKVAPIAGLCYGSVRPQSWPLTFPPSPCTYSRDDWSFLEENLCTQMFVFGVVMSWMSPMWQDVTWVEKAIALQHLHPIRCINCKCNISPPNGGSLQIADMMRKRGIRGRKMQCEHCCGAIFLYYSVGTG